MDSGSTDTRTFYVYDPQEVLAINPTCAVCDTYGCPITYTLSGTYGDELVIDQDNRQILFQTDDKTDVANYPNDVPVSRTLLATVTNNGAVNQAIFKIILIDNCVQQSLTMPADQSVTFYVNEAQSSVSVQPTQSVSTCGALEYSIDIDDSPVVSLD